MRENVIDLASSKWDKIVNTILTDDMPTQATMCDNFFNSITGEDTPYMDTVDSLCQT